MERENDFIIATITDSGINSERDRRPGCPIYRKPATLNRVLKLENGRFQIDFTLGNAGAMHFVADRVIDTRNGESKEIVETVIEREVKVKLMEILID